MYSSCGCLKVTYIFKIQTAVLSQKIQGWIMFTLQVKEKVEEDYVEI